MGWFICISFFISGATPKADAQSAPPTLGPSPGFTPSPQKTPSSDRLQFLQNPSAAAAITADELLEDRERKRVIGRGFADIRFLGKRVQADHIEIQTETRDGVATGNIIFQTGNDRIVGSRVDFNLDSEHMVIYDARGYVAATYYITGNVIRRIAHDRYEVIDGTFTTCEGDTPDWAFHTKKATFQIEGYAHLQAPLISLKGLTAAALPYAILPIKTKRTTGFLKPGFGTGSSNGFQFSPTFFWAINQWSDATLGFDYYSDRGTRYRGEYRYELSANTRGEIRADTFKDREEDTTLSTIKAFHISKLPQFGGELKIFVDEATRSNDDRSLEENLDERVRQDTDTRATFTASVPGITNSQLQIALRRREGLRESDGQLFQEFPKVSLEFNQTPIGTSEFLLDLDSSVVSFHRVEDRNTTRLARADVSPSVSLPIRTVPWLGVTPKFGIRYTYWTDRKVNSDVSDNPKHDEQEEEGLSREIWFSSLNVVGPRFSRVYKGEVGPFQDFKHVFSFDTTYNYAPAMDSNDRRLIIPVDSVDSFEDQNSITYGITNRILTKLKTTEGIQTRQLLTASLTQTADIAESRRKQNLDTTPRRPFSNVVLDLQSRPISLLRLTHSTSYNVYEDEIDGHTTGLLLDGGRNWYFSVDRSWARQRSRGHFPQEGQSFFNFAGGLSLTPQWFVEYITRINNIENTTLEQSVIVRYRGCCWGFNLIFTDTQDTSEVFFNFSLKGILEGEESPTFKRSRSVSDEGRFLGGGSISPLPFDPNN